jgi:hypothetical protein
MCPLAMPIKNEAAHDDSKGMTPSNPSLEEHQERSSAKTKLRVFNSMGFGFLRNPWAWSLLCSVVLGLESGISA